MVPIGVIGRYLGAGIARTSQNSGHPAGVLAVGHGGARKDAEVGIQNIVGFAPVLQIKSMTDRQVAHVARQRHSLGSVHRDPARHRVPHGRILYVGPLRRLPRHVEVHRIVALQPALSQLMELNTLDLIRQKSLADQGVAAVVSLECVARSAAV